MSESRQGVCSNHSPANLTGPCLISACSGNSAGASCGTIVSLCTKGDTNFLSFFDQSTAEPERCQFFCERTCTSGCPNKTPEQLISFCEFENLGGEIGGSDDTWSLYDATSTVMLTVSKLYDEAAAKQSTFFYVNRFNHTELSRFDYFTDLASVMNTETPVSTVAPLTTSLSSSDTVALAMPSPAGVVTATTATVLPGTITSSQPPSVIPTVVSSASNSVTSEGASAVASTSVNNAGVNLRSSMVSGRTAASIIAMVILGLLKWDLT